MPIHNEMWALMQEYIPRKKSKVGRPEHCIRKSLEGIFYVLETGCQWKHLPQEYGKKSTVHRKFLELARTGVFKKIHEIFLHHYEEKRGKFGIWYAFDAISVKAPLALEKCGKNPTDRGKKGTKRNLIVDQRGAPYAISIGGANTHDSQFVEEILKNSTHIFKKEEIKVMATDSAYDSKKCRTLFKNNGFILLAAENPRRKKIENPYRPLHRWIVERTHSWLNNFRSLKIRWSKLEISYQAFCLFAASIQLFRMSRILG